MSWQHASCMKLLQTGCPRSLAAGTGCRAAAQLAGPGIAWGRSGGQPQCGWAKLLGCLFTLGLAGWEVGCGAGDRSSLFSRSYYSAIFISTSKDIIHKNLTLGNSPLGPPLSYQTLCSAPARLALRGGCKLCPPLVI